MPKDDVESAAWYRKSAEHGYAEAQLALAVRYKDGQGVQQNDADALKWLTKAAEQGLPTAQYTLGSCYYDGLGMPQDDKVLSYAWLNLASASGHAQAKERRDHVASKMTSAEIAKGQQLSREWEAQQAANTTGSPR